MADGAPQLSMRAFGTQQNTPTSLKMGLGDQMTFDRTRSLNKDNRKTGFNFYSDQLKEDGGPVAYSSSTSTSMLDGGMQAGMGN
jgi:hypothetical protein